MLQPVLAQTWQKSALSHQPDNIRSMHSFSQRKFIQEDCSGLLGQHLPSLQDLYNSRVKKRAGHIITDSSHRGHNTLTDSSHPGHNLFALLPSGRRYRSLCTRIWISRHKTAPPPPHHAISSPPHPPPPCHLQPKQLTQELVPVFCNSLSIYNYYLSLKYYVNTYAYFLHSYIYIYTE